MSLSSTSESRGSTTLLTSLYARFEPLRDAVEAYGQPIVSLIARLWMAKIFFDAGWSRVNNWGSQEFLFGFIHPVPFLPPALAAPITTVGELTLAVLLAFGLLGRLSAAGLLVMTMTIQWIVGATPEGIENGIAHPSHYLWMLVFGLLIVYGPGKLSLDHLLGKRS
ncbi:DoxX family protein [Algihabitans albus]|uniref:DoxX family protein n=1 Tax=Algihabitans albus TaxID=2164067 RepID=UPI000E5D9181|nr:DoxX family protein [Algihabitans albus]